jgi:signal transduction histidine kinase
MKYPDKIFDRNYTEQQGGHGIGMHIVQRLCSELDIGITIDSQENIGTTICLNF